MIQTTSLTLSLPDWIQDFISTYSLQFDSTEKKMSFVLELCKNNILKKTGGPFSAAIFNMETNQLVACGVNRVVPENCSAAHAEIMAIMFAQKILNTFDFSLKGKYQMVTSSKMCIMCMGNVIWSGLAEVVYSADTNDVQEITGFDQGPAPKQYSHELKIRGIEVVQRILHSEGRQMLKLYAGNKGYIYNCSLNKLSMKQN